MRMRDQVVIQRPFLHDLATGQVDEDGIILHAAKLSGADQAVGGAGKRRRSSFSRSGVPIQSTC